MAFDRFPGRVTENTFPSRPPFSVFKGSIRKCKGARLRRWTDAFPLGFSPRRLVPAHFDRQVFGIRVVESDGALHILKHDGRADTPISHPLTFGADVLEIDCACIAVEVLRPHRNPPKTNPAAMTPFTI